MSISLQNPYIRPLLNGAISSIGTKLVGVVTTTALGAGQAGLSSIPTSSATNTVVGISAVAMGAITACKGANWTEKISRAKHWTSSLLKLNLIENGVSKTSLNALSSSAIAATLTAKFFSSSSFSLASTALVAASSAVAAEAILGNNKDGEQRLPTDLSDEKRRLADRKKLHLSIAKANREEHKSEQNDPKEIMREINHWIRPHLSTGWFRKIWGFNYINSRLAAPRENTADPFGSIIISLQKNETTDWLFLKTLRQLLKTLTTKKTSANLTVTEKVYDFFMTLYACILAITIYPVMYAVSTWLANIVTDTIDNYFDQNKQVPIEGFINAINKILDGINKTTCESIEAQDSPLNITDLVIKSMEEYNNENDAVRLRSHEFMLSSFYKYSKSTIAILIIKIIDWFNSKMSDKYRFNLYDTTAKFIKESLGIHDTHTTDNGSSRESASVILRGVRALLGNILLILNELEHKGDKTKDEIINSNDTELLANDFKTIDDDIQLDESSKSLIDAIQLTTQSLLFAVHNLSSLNGDTQKIKQSLNTQDAGLDIAHILDLYSGVQRDDMHGVYNDIGKQIVPNLAQLIFQFTKGKRGNDFICMLLQQVLQSISKHTNQKKTETKSVVRKECGELAELVVQSASEKIIEKIRRPNNSSVVAADLFVRITQLDLASISNSLNQRSRPLNLLNSARAFSDKVQDIVTILTALEDGNEKMNTKEKTIFHDIDLKLRTYRQYLPSKIAQYSLAFLIAEMGENDHNKTAYMQENKEELNQLIEFFDENKTNINLYLSEAQYTHLNELEESTDKMTQDEFTETLRELNSLKAEDQYNFDRIKVLLENLSRHIDFHHNRTNEHGEDQSHPDFVDASRALNEVLMEYTEMQRTETVMPSQIKHRLLTLCELDVSRGIANASEKLIADTIKFFETNTWVQRRLVKETFSSH